MVSTNIYYVLELIAHFVNCRLGPISNSVKAVQCGVKASALDEVEFALIRVF